VTSCQFGSRRRALLSSTFALNVYPTHKKYEEIISYIPYSDTIALAQTSRRLRKVASPRLRLIVPLLASEKTSRCIRRLAGDTQRAFQILEIHLPKPIPGSESPYWCFGQLLIGAPGRAIPPHSYRRHTRSAAFMKPFAIWATSVQSWDNSVVIPCSCGRIAVALAIGWAGA
jgi:hypothetical protein